MAHGYACLTLPPPLADGRKTFPCIPPPRRKTDAPFMRIWWSSPPALRRIAPLSNPLDGKAWKPSVKWSWHAAFTMAASSPSPEPTAKPPPHPWWKRFCCAPERPPLPAAITACRWRKSCSGIPCRTCWRWRSAPSSWKPSAIFTRMWPYGSILRRTTWTATNPWRITTAPNSISSTTRRKKTWPSSAPGNGFRT